MFELLPADDKGIRYAKNDDTGQTITVMPDGESRLFKRHAFRMQPGGDPDSHTEWLVGELDGVRVYVDGSSIILTRQNLYP